MDEFYGEKKDKHVSPTKRLIAQKIQTSEHKELIAREGTRT